MASISAVPMLLALPVLALLSFLAARLLRLLRALRGRKAPGSLPAPASASALGHAKTRTPTQWARASAAWVPAAFAARVPALSFPRVPWVRVASDAPDAPRSSRRDSTLIELLPTSALPPPPMASPPPTGVFSPPAEAGHHQLIDVSDTAGPSTSTYPPAHPPSYAYAAHAQHIPAPRPAHFIPAPKALSSSSPSTRAATPLTRLATTPPPPPHRRSRSLGGVPVRRLSGGSSTGSGSGLRHAVGAREGVLIDFSSSGEGADGDAEGERGVSAVSSSSAVSDIGLAALVPGKVPSDSGAALLHPHRVALPLQRIAPLVDISDASPVNEKEGREEQGGVDDAAWRWFGAPWAPPTLVTATYGGVGALGRAMPSVPVSLLPVPVSVYSAAAAVPTLLAPRVPGLKNAQDAEYPLVDVGHAPEAFLDLKENENGKSADVEHALLDAEEDPFADPVPASVSQEKDSAWNWDAPIPAANANPEEVQVEVDEDEDEYAAEQRALAYAEDPFADPVPPLSISARAAESATDAVPGVQDRPPWWDGPAPAPIPTSHADAKAGDEGALLDIEGTQSAPPGVGAEEDAPWWDMPVPRLIDDAAAAGPALGAPLWDADASALRVEVDEAPLVDIEDTPPHAAEDATQEDAPWWDMRAPLAAVVGVAPETGVSDDAAPWWDMPTPIPQEIQRAEEGALISLEDDAGAQREEELAQDPERVMHGAASQEDGAQEQEQACPDPALMDLPGSTAEDVHPTAADNSESEGEGEAYPDPELLPLPSAPVLQPTALLALADLEAKPVVESTSTSPLASPTPARSGGAPLSQTPTPPASPPPLIAHPRALRTLAFTLTTESGKNSGSLMPEPAPAVAAKMEVASKAAYEDKENAPPALAALAIPRTAPSTSRSTSRATSPSPGAAPGTAGVARPAWSLRADDAPALGLPSSGTGGGAAARRVLGDANVSGELRTDAEAEAEPAPVVVVAPKEVPSLNVTFAPQEKETKKEIEMEEDEEAHSLPGSFPTTPTIAIAPPTPTAAQFGAVASKAPSIAASKTTPTETTPTEITPKTTPAARLRARAGTWAPALARSGPLDLALAMQLRPGLGAGADPAWMVRFLMAVYGWVVVSVAGGF